MGILDRIVLALIVILLGAISSCVVGFEKISLALFILFMISSLIAVIYLFVKLTKKIN